MTIHSVRTNRPTAMTLYAFPASASLANWVASRVALTEAASPNLGKYTGNLDDAINTLWFMFSGSVQPVSWSESIEYFDLGMAQLTDVWRRVGCDPNNPLIDTATAITAGAGLQIAVASNLTQTVLTRQ